MKTYLFFVFSFLFHQFVNSQSGNIAGVVHSADGLIEENLNINLFEINLKTTTNQKGEFILLNVPYGVYTISVSIENKELQSQKIELKEPNFYLNITLVQKELDLEEVKIFCKRSQNEISTSIGKIPIRAFDLPQSTATIEKEILEKQQTQTISDALKNTNGVYIMGNSGGYQEEIAGRGFAFSSSNTFKNGVRFNNTIMPEVSSLERIEIMKGSTAILFGNVSAGGILNLVTKKPVFENGGEVAMRVGSFESYKPTFDIYGSFNNSKKVAYRLNSTYLKSKSFRDQVKAERFYVNPSFIVKITPKLELLLEADYMNDNRTADFGVGAINYQLIDIPRNTYLGTAWSTIKTEQRSFTNTLTYQVTKNWQLKSVTSIQDFKNDLFANTRPNASSQFIKTDGTWIRGIQRTQIAETYGITQLDLTGRFNTGFLKHTLLVGADYDQYTSNTLAFNGITKYDTINVFNIQTNLQRNDIPDLTEKTKTSSPRVRAGAYIQDLIGISDKLKILAGVRFSYLETRSNVYTYKDGSNVSSTMFDHALSPRFGVIYQPIKTISVFSSYSNSFSPNTGVDVNGKALSPSISDQYEIGVKNDLFKGKISLNATVYQITNNNVAQMSLDNGNTNTNIKELAGALSSKGFEIDLNTKPWKGFSFISGYSFNETKYTKSNIYAVGTKVLYQPRNTFNTSMYYEVEKENFLKGLNCGFTVQYFGKRNAGRLTRLTVPNDTYKPIALPDYTQIDLSLGYSKNNVSFRIKVSNITNVLSYNVHDDNSVNPIAPRMYTATISFKL
ncbi:MAG: TonB-dependent siderophore receptor [Flavobacteriia bacterium]|nr:TonB-dependent siderophore receptor [Flavobacteriia bacterium]